MIIQLYLVATSHKYHNATPSTANQCAIEYADNYPKLISYESMSPVSSYTTSFSTSMTQQRNTKGSALAGTEYIDFANQLHDN